MLDIQKLNLYLNRVHILWDVSFTIKPGEKAALLGRNGVGKTSLIQSIMGTYRVSSGTIRVHQKEFQNAASWQRRQAGLAIVPQGRGLFGDLTVEENLRLVIGSSQLPAIIDQYFPEMKTLLNRKAANLSGGQQQLVAISRALAIHPKIILLDEPTEGIQPNLVQRIGEVLDDIAKNFKTTLFIAEQKIPFVQRYSNRFIIMERGRIAMEGQTGDLNGPLLKRYLSV